MARSCSLHSPEGSIGMLRGRCSRGHASLCCGRCSETVAKSWWSALLWSPPFIKPALHYSISTSLLTHITHEKSTHKINKNSTVLCKSNASEMREFRSLFPWIFDEVRLKVRMKFHGILSDNSLEERAIFFRSFFPLKKIVSTNDKSPGGIRNFATYWTAVRQHSRNFLLVIDTNEVCVTYKR